MAGLEDLDFEPSRKLSFITGLVEGITELHKNTKAEEAAAAKQQNSLIPHLLRQMQFQQTERREGEEFRAEQGLAVQRESRLGEEFRLKFAETQKQSALNIAELDAKITNWQESIRIADSKLDIEQDRVGLEERRVINTEAQTIIDGLRVELQNLQATLQEAGRTSRAEAAIESAEGIAERKETGVQGRFESGQTAGKVRDAATDFKDAQDLLTNIQLELAKEVSVFGNKEQLSLIAVSRAKSLMATWIKLDAEARINGDISPPFPQELETFKDDAWYRRAIFGVRETVENTSESQPKRKDLLTTLTKPAATEPTPAALPKASNKVQEAIDAAKRNKRTTLTSEIIKGLKQRGYTDEEIEQIKAGL